jgi:hypothetical protein
VQGADASINPGSSSTPLFREEFLVASIVNER